MPTLPYVLCTLTQVAACVLALGVPARVWDSGTSQARSANGGTSTAAVNLRRKTKMRPNHGFSSLNAHDNP